MVEAAACLLLQLAVGVGGAGPEGQGFWGLLLNVSFLPFLHQHCQLLGSEAIVGHHEKKVPLLISNVAVCRGRTSSSLGATFQPHLKAKQ